MANLPNWHEISPRLVPQMAALGVFLLTAWGAWLLGRALLQSPPNTADEAWLRRGPRTFGPFTKLLSLLLPTFPGTAAKLDGELLKAGYYYRGARLDFLAIRSCLVWGCVGLACLLWWSESQSSAGPRKSLYVVSGVAIALAFSMPRIILHAQAERRTKRIVMGLPDALDMTTMALAGGVPLHESLSRVGPEIKPVHPDLGQELEIVQRHAETGSLVQALRQFAQRIDVVELKSLAALVSQSERLGSGVGKALQEYADGIRRSHRQRAEERGNKASVKMVLPVVFCLAPPIYILLLGPAVLELRGFVARENQPGGILDPIDPNNPPEVDLAARRSQGIDISRTPFSKLGSLPESRGTNGRGASRRAASP